MTVEQAIAEAESVLPGRAILDGGDDPRWAAVYAVGEFIDTDPEDVWSFVERWGDHADEDLRDAIACCLLEHLLEHHFDLIFPRAERAAKRSRFFALTFSRCWKFGQSEMPDRSERFDRLKTWCQELA